MINRYRPTPICSPKSTQSGAVLLAFLLILVSGASFMLLSKLNKSTQASNRTAQSYIALKQAKEILIGYASTYPDKVNNASGPGYLPCPDLTNDGLSGGACSFLGATSLRRFPRTTLDMNNLFDGSGEVLWYAVSDNFRNNPKIVPLNSETPGTLGVDRDGDGNADETDLVAILFAPGESFAGQNRDLDKNAVAHYLEGENADGDRLFSTVGSGDFNDQLITISRAELMQAVESRVLAEADRILTDYRYPNYHDDTIPVANRTTPDRLYPWLSPFADPKVMTPVLTGTVTSSVTGPPPVLIDSSATFVSSGVSVGDVVANLSNTAVGQVVSVDSETQITTASMSGVTTGAFSAGDEYVVRPSGAGFVNRYASTAGAASTGNILADTSTALNFTDLGVNAGLVIENTSADFAGVIEKINPEGDGSNHKLSFINTAGDTFAAGDAYRPRMNIGTATNAAPSLTLEDSTSTRNFLDRGIVVGDIIENLTDGSVGKVSNVADDSITASSLKHGTTNLFSNGDVYMFSRFNGVTGAREGLLPIHSYGMSFASGFSASWTMPATGTTVVTNSSSTLADSTQDTLYWSIISDFVRSSSIINAGSNEVGSGPRSLGSEDGNCVWLGLEIADCRGVTASEPYLEGSVDAVSDSGLRLVDDASHDYPRWGVEVGDIVRNYSVTGGALVNGTVTATISSTATSGSSGSLLEDTTRDFDAEGIVAGQYKVVNDTTGNEGEVLAVNGDQLTAEASVTFNDLESYSIVYDEGDLLVDTGTDFSLAGILAYDYIAKNTTSGEEGIVTVVTPTTLAVMKPDSTQINFAPSDTYSIERVAKGPISAVTETTILAANLTAGSVFNVGDSYGLSVATERLSSSADFVFQSGSVWIVRDSVATREFGVAEGIAVGDTIINTTSGEVGTVLFVVGRFFLADIEFTVADNFTIRHHFVAYREYEFNLRYRASSFSAASNISYTNGLRTRDLQLSGSLPVQSAAPLVRIIDTLQSGELVTTDVTIPDAVSLPSGSLSLSGIQYDFSEDNNEVPGWFVENHWHRLLYVSFASDTAPGGGGDCTVGPSCLVLAGRSADDGSNDSIVISMGNLLGNLDRTSGALTEFLENDNNTAGDDSFVIDDFSATYNDRIRIVE